MLSEWWSDTRYRLRALFRRGAMDRELRDELAFHVEREAEQLERSGVRRAEAYRRARVAFGSVDAASEASRDGRGLLLLDRVRQDLRYAVRSLRNRPGFTAAVILTLGLGIGANAAIFGVVDRLMFRPPPLLRDPGQVHRVYLTYLHDGRDITEESYQYTRYRDLQRWSTTIAAAAGYTQRRLAVGSGDAAREMPVAIASASLFDFFDAPPALGRYFGPAEDTVPVGAPVAVLSHAVWRSRYGQRADVLGQSLRIGSVVHTVIGVAPRGFVGLADQGDPAVFIPITSYAASRPGEDGRAYYTHYNWGWMQMLVRRKPDVTVATASADLTSAYLRSWERERELHPAVPPPGKARPRAIAGPVQSARGPAAGPDAKVALWVGGVSLVVLLIACANVANLLLARGLQRRRELAVRLALGVSRPRLVAQLLVESVLLAMLGGAAGLGLAQGLGGVVRALFLPDDTAAGVLSDPRTLVFASLAALLTGILVGLAPALQACRGDVAASLKSAPRQTAHDRSRLRTGLLVAQAALSVALLVGAGLFVRSLWNVRSLRLGYDVDPVLLVRPNQRGERLSRDEVVSLGRRLEEAARSLPGVEGVTRATSVPFWLSESRGLTVDGIDSVSRLGSFSLQAGSPDYFRTTGTRILRGRGIEASDREGTPLVAVVSEPMALALWPGRDAIGQCFRIGDRTAPCRTVVGVTEPLRLRSLDGRPANHFFLPIEQFSPEQWHLFVRTRGPAARHAEAIRRELQRLMPGESYMTAVPMRDVLGGPERSWSLGATMFGAFGGLALAIAALGLYSSIAYGVTQRSGELGIRMALGAGPGRLVRMVVAQGFGLAAAGIAIGMLIALAGGRWIGPLLFDQSPRDPVVFGAVAAVLGLVAVAASLAPARRAARVDPCRTLRAE